MTLGPLDIFPFKSATTGILLIVYASWFVHPEGAHHSATYLTYQRTLPLKLALSDTYRTALHINTSLPIEKKE